MRRSNRDEWARRMVAWYEDTTPEQRGGLVGGIVVLGLLALPVMITTYLVLAVVVVQLLRHRRIGCLLRGGLACLFVVHVPLWLARWVLLKRLRQRTAGYVDSTRNS
jgi:hypothetical protein